MLRLVPFFPFWLVNLVAGVGRRQAARPMCCHLFRHDPGTFVYASLGTGLGALVEREPRSGFIFQPSVLLPIVGLAAAGAGPGRLQALARRRGPELAE